MAKLEFKNMIKLEEFVIIRNTLMINTSIYLINDPSNLNFTILFRKNIFLNIHSFFIKVMSDSAGGIGGGVAVLVLIVIVWIWCKCCRKVRTGVVVEGEGGYSSAVANNNTTIINQVAAPPQPSIIMIPQTYGYGVPPYGSGAPPGYGVPQGYGVQPGYGAPSYAAPPRYGAQPYYGVPQAYNV